MGRARGRGAGPAAALAAPPAAGARAALGLVGPIITMALNARAERLLGCNAVSVVTHTYFITRDFDRNFSAWQKVPVARSVLPFGLFVWACWCADRLHFYCDRGMLPPRERLIFNFFELEVYRRLGIDVFLWTYGARRAQHEATQALGEPNCSMSRLIWTLLSVEAWSAHSECSAAGYSREPLRSREQASRPVRIACVA